MILQLRGGQYDYTFQTPIPVPEKTDIDVRATVETQIYYTSLVGKSGVTNNWLPQVDQTRMLSHHSLGLNNAKIHPLLINTAIINKEQYGLSSS